VSILAAEHGCELLPLAEIDFSGFPADKPHIVDYKAKWDPSSFEFHHTPRRFLGSAAEPSLRDELETLSQRCWDEFQLGGYARVDFRVDPKGRPWILEINTNPCLSPDAGFQAALAQGDGTGKGQGKITFPQAIARILDDGLRRAGKLTSHPAVLKSGIA